MKPVRDVTAVVLAGGRARRMGGQDKGLITLNQALLIEYALTALHDQVDAILINANRNIERYETLGYPVIEDRHSGFNGPLAGMASALSSMHTRFLVTVPCDSPALPLDLVDRLLAARARDGAELAVAHDGTRMQPVFALLERTLLPSLEQFLEADGRKIDQWYARHRLALADFSDQPDAFTNVNTPEDLARMARTPALARPRPPVSGQRLP
jgi:molybdopterin-guanine dinucleotide biosynthesis protein A